jgi:hypothetical protein
VRLDELTAGQVERLYAAKLAAGQAPKSSELLHTAFNGPLKHAKGGASSAATSWTWLTRRRCPSTRPGR